ncbi:MAG: hypothetical protein JWM05_1081 [Acidimicrobiales bacterium]|nr:hypothetical protein [Acidimicrobiales bacterium]
MSSHIWRHQAHANAHRRPADCRHGSHRGAALVEMALVLPIFMMLVFGIIDFTSALTSDNALQAGTREGARSAIVGDVGTDITCPTYGGASISTATNQLICLTKSRTGLDQTQVRVKVIVPASYAPGTTLTVCTMYPEKSVSGFFSAALNGKIFTTAVHMRVETTNTDLQSFAETSLPGGSFSWCS